jgi:hypothetical protein
MFQLLSKLKQNEKLSSRVDHENFDKFMNLIGPILTVFNTNSPSSTQMSNYFSSLGNIASEYNNNNNQTEYTIVKDSFKMDRMKDSELNKNMEKFKDEYENIVRCIDFDANSVKKSSSERKLHDLIIQLFLLANYLMHKKMIANDLVFKYNFYYIYLYKNIKYIKKF